MDAPLGHSSSPAGPADPPAGRKTPLPPPPVLEAAGQSHPGRQRRRNEDAFAVHLDLGLFVVADGMGGHAAGEVASRVAVEAVAAHVHAGTASRAVDLLVEAVRAANHAVLDASRADIHAHDMGTTIASVLVRGDRVVVAHVGDSRVYRHRKGRLETLTDDHSLVAECVRSGYLTPERALSFPYKHFITRSLGADDRLEVDVRVIEAQPGDVILLCSDGLSGVVDEEDIARILDAEPCVDAAAQRLVDRANAAGGPDNVTVVIVRWPT